MGTKGALTHPLSLTEALSTAADHILPGRTIYLRAGVYALNSDLLCKLKGTAEAPITIKPYPGERVTLDIRTSRLDFSQQQNDVCHFVHLENLEIMSSTLGRVSEQAGSDPNDIGRNSVFFSGQGMEIRGCLIHDVHDVGWWTSAHSGVMKDCLIWNVGWLGTDRAHGHGLYTQNDNSAGVKRVQNCLFGANFDYTLHAFGKTGSTLRGYEIQNCTFLDCPVLMGGDTPLEDIEIEGCTTWNCNLSLGYEYEPLLDNISLVMMHNRLWGRERRPLTLMPFLNLTASGNWIESSRPTQSKLDYVPAISAESLNWDENTYSQLGTLYLNGVGKTLTEWRSATGFDLHSQLSDDPISNQVTSTPCTTPGKVATIRIENWQQFDTVLADVSGLELINGQFYSLRDIYSPLTPVQFIYAGSGTISIDMLGRTATAPTNYSAPLAIPDLRFGAFLLELG